MSRPASGILCLVFIYVTDLAQAQSLPNAVSQGRVPNVTLSSRVSVINELQCQKELVCRVDVAKADIKLLLGISILDKGTNTVLKRAASIYYLKSKDLTTSPDVKAGTESGILSVNGSLIVRKALLPNTGFNGEEFTCKVQYVDWTLATKSVEADPAGVPHDSVCKIPDLFRKVDTLDAKLNSLSNVDEKLNNLGKMLSSLPDIQNKLDTLQIQLSNISDLDSKLDVVQRRLDRLSDACKPTEAPSTPPDSDSGPAAANEIGDICSCDGLRDLDQGLDITARYIITWSNGAKVLCDTTTDGGGWTVFQRRSESSFDFYRGWEDYENGFGDVDADFWMGLKQLQAFLETGEFELRIDMKHRGSDNILYAQYSHFSLSPPDSYYKINITGFSGTVPRDSMAHSDGRPFSTFDVDNDGSSSINCARTHIGAWWYIYRHGYCSKADLNSYYSSKGLFWEMITPDSNHASFSEMKVRKVKVKSA